MNLIYYMKIDILSGGAAFERAYGRVFPDRRHRIDACRTTDGKRESLAASYLLAVAARDAGRSPEECKLSLTNDGKPYFTGEALAFSLSHGGGLAVCAVSECAVGVDTEAVSDRALRVSARFFTDAERAYIEGLVRADRAEAATRIWTIKESYAKAVGCGIAKAYSGFTAPLTAERCTVLPHEGFHISEILIDGNAVAVCAVSAEQFELSEVTEIK